MTVKDQVVADCSKWDAGYGGRRINVNLSVLSGFKPLVVKSRSCLLRLSRSISRIRQCSLSVVVACSRRF